LEVLCAGGSTGLPFTPDASQCSGLLFASEIFFLLIVFYSGMDSSFPEILILFYTVMIPGAPQETVGEAEIEPGTAA
jgi:hypothetical protein